MLLKAVALALVIAGGKDNTAMAGTQSSMVEH
jgi:hypothetical protein